MSLQRGTYGIEYDERSGTSFRVSRLIVALLPVVAVVVLFARGCRNEGETESDDGKTVGPTHYRLAESETPHERPSLWSSLFQREKPSDAGTAPEPVSGWRTAGVTPPPETLVQSPEIRRLLEQAGACVEEDDLVGARRFLREILLRRDADSVRAFAEREIGRLNIKLLFADRPMPEKVKHRVASGEVVSRLAKRYGNTPELILKANGIDRPERLRIGREIWVLDAPVFELTVYKNGGSAVLTLNGSFFKRYPLLGGIPVKAPSGTYALRGKVALDGVWRIMLAATGATPEAEGLALHGGADTPATDDRIRFATSDIEELSVLLPVGAAVNIAE